MAKRSKRLKAIREQVDRGRSYEVSEALALLKGLSSVKFAESVDVSINLGVDPRKSDQVVRGSTVMPNGIGKESRVAVFAQGAAADSAREAGADIVGMDDLAERVTAGNLDFDVVIAAPDAMRVVGKLGRILGPRGLMPNPKVGTVTPRCRRCRSQRQSRTGPVPNRPRWNYSLHHRQSGVRGRCAEAESRRLARGFEQGETRHIQGRLYEKGHVVDHDGTWDRNRQGNPGALRQALPRFFNEYSGPACGRLALTLGCRGRLENGISTWPGGRQRPQVDIASSIRR